MSSRLSSGVGALAVLLVAGHAFAQAGDEEFTPSGRPQKAEAGKSRLARTMSLGATAESVLAAGRELNPALRAAALETSAAAAKAAGADKLDDPTISDSYQYWRDPNVFSAHAVMVTQAIPLWGKRDLRRTAFSRSSPAARLR
jgi:hypothetical protein